MYRSCKCPVEQAPCRCSSNESQSSSDDVCHPCEPNGCPCSCFPCDKPMVRGKFGLAYVIETPKKKFCKPLGWQVEFEDTPSRIVNNCEKMMKWVNCPPLGDCNNIETNFCAYPEDCGKLLREQRSCQPKCCCSPKLTKREKERSCCVREPKKKSKNSPACNQNREPVCIFCESCKVNAPGCCNPANVHCCSKTRRKSPPCKCENRNERCKCCTKEDVLEKFCFKCCRPKLNTFFRESLDKRYCDDLQYDRCCCAKKFCICDDMLDYIPKKDVSINEKNTRIPDKDKQKDRPTSYRDRSSSPRTEVRDKPRINKVESNPKEVNASNEKPRAAKSPVRATNKNEPIKVEAKPAQSANLIDELQDRLKERNKEKEKDNEVAAPEDTKKKETETKNPETTSVVANPPTEPPKDVSPKEIAPEKFDVPDKKNNLESQEVANKQPTLQSINESLKNQNDEFLSSTTSSKNEEEKVNSEEASTDDASEVIEVEQPGEVQKNPITETKNDQSIQPVKSHPSLLQRIKNAQKKQHDEIHPPKVPTTTQETELRKNTEQKTENPSKPPNEGNAEKEMQKVDYEESNKTVVDEIQDAHQKQIHEVLPNEVQ